MIAFDTNFVVRMLVEDDKRQAGAVQKTVLYAEKNAIQILILSEVLIETVWVLESVYQCTKHEITQFLETLISASTFTHPNPDVIRKAIQQYKRGGDFADFVIVEQAKKKQAKSFFSFDKKLQKKYPDYVVSNISVTQGIDKNTKIG
ncbi:MAG: type II toxin-antitoxin system VapC family toxin [Deltaproteobacteria bacterium]|nr:type II toxin-antitoxin system VapC family toxin [Deltaproteobacteria bacterium]MBW2120187.1 type II toxin-antitoxin system VapC family toxin [Deltaproteobacteria bacterium]